jgi:FtsH-binding integral membrane protein
MNYYETTRSNYHETTRSDAFIDSRASFIVKTYVHLFGAILLFIVFETAIFASGYAPNIAYWMTSINWLVPLGLYMAVSWVASRFADSSESIPMQYLGLVFYVAATSFIFIPLLFIAQAYVPGVIGRAGIVTLLGSSALTMIAFFTRKDFSFLGSILGWGIMCAIILIVAGSIFDFALGTWFSVAMIAFAGAAVLYDTSNIIHHYPDDRYVGAAVRLFASIAMMFYYVLQVMLAFSSRD